MQPRSSRQRRRSLGRSFFPLLLALSLPFWSLGAVSGARLAPALPVSALMFVCPAAAAMCLTYRAHGRAGVAAQLRRALDAGRIRPARWYAPTLLLAPAVVFTAYACMRLVGVRLPAAPWSPAALGGAVALLVAAFGEELGFTGYALPRLLTRRSALQSGLVLGAVWAAWHLVPLAQAGRSASWVAGWCLWTVAARVVMTWLYAHTRGSVLAAALFHASMNVAWQLFPDRGSHYDPRVSGPIMAAVAAVIVAAWRPADRAPTA